MSGNTRIRKNKFKKKPLKERYTLRLPLGFLLKTGMGGGLLLLFSLGLIFVHDFLTQWNYLNARDIRIEGQRRLSRGEILSQAQIGNSDNILAINLAMARARLLSHPWIAEADIRRDFPATIAIRIREHQAVAVIDLGRELLIDEEGEIFKEKVAGESMDLPVITGLDYSDLNSSGRNDSVALKAIFNLIAIVKKHHRGMTPFPISRIEVDRDLGLTIAVTGPVRSVFMGYEEYEDKYRKLKEVLAFLETNKQFPDIEAIDISTLNRIVIRPAVMLSSSGNGKGGLSCKDKT